MSTTVKNSKLERSGTFVDNMKLPIHRWFRFSAGFSAEWAERYLESIKSVEKRLVLDPFAGSGSVLAQARVMKRKAIGFDINKDYKKMYEEKVFPQIKQLWETRVKELNEREKTQLILQKTIKKSQP